MTQDYTEKGQEREALDAMLKSGDAFRFISGFEKSKAYETDENGEKKKYIEFIGSSDQEDLVGDVMTVNALKEMVETAPGTVMLRDHNRSTDKIFGWILEGELVKANGINLIKFKAEVDDEDQANIRIWKSIKKGFKIGASVTVVIVSKEKNPNSANKKAMIIDSVKLLEISIVTIPCNQESWTLAATASKALQLAENAQILTKAAESIPSATPVLAAKKVVSEATPTDEESAEINTKKEVEENMSDKNQIAAQGAETVVENQEVPAAAAPVVETEEPAAETVPAEAAAPSEESKNAMPRTIAAMKAHSDRRAAAEESKTAPEVPQVVTKGLFAEEQAKRQPTLWDLFDILYSVKWQLMDRKWAFEWVDVDDIVDDYDYVGEYNTACQEFADAAVKSFVYYGGFKVDADAALDTNGDGITDDTISNAFDIQKSFEVFAELFTKSPEENKQKMLTIGEQFVELAKGAGIPLGAEATATAEVSEPTEEVIRKSQVFIDTDARASEAEKRADTAESELEVAKAGLATALEVIEKINRQPLHIGSR
jgi:phage head maturation protease